MNFCSDDYVVVEKKKPNIIVYIGQQHQGDVPPVKNLSRSVYKNNPDLDALEGATRKKALGAIRARRHRAKKDQELARYYCYRILQCILLNVLFSVKLSKKGNGE